jgi:glucose dehydrogenase
VENQPAITRFWYLQALHSRTGSLLWKTQLGASTNSGPISYRVGNKQYVSIVCGLSLFVFALDE